MWKQKNVALDDLLLDPNNPRFASDLRPVDLVPDDLILKEQATVLSRFRKDREAPSFAHGDDAEHDEFFGVKGLVDSMRTIGFMPIDRIVVRKLAGSEKYLVLEGNRRVSAAKLLRTEDNDKQIPSARMSSENRQSLEELTVLVLATDGLTEDEVSAQVAIILGLRHFGAVLPWGPLPRAFNIYSEYMHLEPPQEECRLDNARVQVVRARLAIELSEVKRSLRTYVAYVQLRDHLGLDEGPRPRHYSLLQEVVANNMLKNHGYVDADRSTFKLTEEAIEGISTVCQFGTRDSKGFDPILRDPKSVKSFARLVGDARGHASTAVQQFARGWLGRVESAECSLDDAVQNVARFRKAEQWVGELTRLLERRESKLPHEDYVGEGNELMHMQELQKAFRNLRLVVLGTAH